MYSLFGIKMDPFSAITYGNMHVVSTVIKVVIEKISGSELFSQYLGEFGKILELLIVLVIIIPIVTKLSSSTSFDAISNIIKSKMESIRLRIMHYKYNYRYIQEEYTFNIRDCTFHQVHDGFSDMIVYILLKKNKLENFCTIANKNLVWDTDNNYINLTDDIFVQTWHNERIISDRDVHLKIYTICMWVKSKKHIDIFKYFESIKNEYNKKSLKRYIFSVSNLSKIEFSESNLFNDFTSDETLINFESFDTIFNANSELIKDMIDNFDDIEFHKRNGIRRKLSLLFEGSPGTGKTSMIIAMANYTKRHIVNIDFGKITKSNDILRVFNTTTIKDIQLERKNTIYVFDEIKINENVDIGGILTVLDGIGSYEGMIIVATTNFKDKLPEALIRDMRLTSINFGFMRNIDVINMAKVYYNNNKWPFKKDPKGVTGAKARFLTKKNKSIDKFIADIKQYY